MTVLQDVLLFSNALARLVEAVGAGGGDGDEVVGWAEAARGDVALLFWGALVSHCERGRVMVLEVYAYLVLYWLVATSWGEVLSHTL